jgi:hypothetical protein
MAIQHIDHLWQFVKVKLPENEADAGDARIPFVCPLRASFLGIPVHGPELEYLEDHAIAPNPVLSVENGAR